MKDEARDVGLLPAVSRGRWRMSMEPPPVGGERRSPVTELGPDAAGELVALSGTAYPLTAEPDRSRPLGRSLPN